MIGVASEFRRRALPESQSQRVRPTVARAGEHQGARLWPQAWTRGGRRWSIYLRAIDDLYDARPGRAAVARPRPRSASINRRRSRQPPSLRCSPAATCSASPRPAPARPPPSPCRCCSTWQASRRQPHRYATRALILAPTRELRCRSRKACTGSAATDAAASSPSSAASAASCRCSGCGRAPTSWSARPAGSAT